MKKTLTTLAILSTSYTWANTSPIEPVLVPIVNKIQNINIQMGKYEVTVEEFTRFANATGYQVKEACHLYNKNHTPAKTHGTWNNPELTENPYTPVVCIGAKDAMAYANWLATSTGKPYRLPEFNEWEFAASGGKVSRFDFGDDLNHSEICNYENVDDFAHNAGLKQHHGYRHNYGVNCNDGAIYHTVVGMYRPNTFGLHDIMGNVRELTKTCGVFNKNQPEQCLHNIVAGGAWHWIPNPQHLKNNMMFVGSIEGFRLVLDSAQTVPISKPTSAFIKDLKKAQNLVNIDHKKLKSLPKRPEHVKARLLENKKVKLSWLSTPNNKTTYDIYRSYLDYDGKHSRKMTKIATGIQGSQYLDELPDKNPASYQIFANNTIGESQPSKNISIGQHHTFEIGERIQAEFYHHHRKATILEKDKLQSVLLSPNDGYYPPDIIPNIPAWVTYPFNSSVSGKATLTMNMRGTKGAIIEFWQGKNLVAKAMLDGSRELKTKTIPAHLISGIEPIQIRGATSHSVILDWFEFNNQ